MGTSGRLGRRPDSFRVETVGFNEKTWLDRLGHAHSDQLKVTENFRRIDRDHLELDHQDGRSEGACRGRG